VLLQQVLEAQSFRRMKLFKFFTQELAIDLGTANTLIIQNDQIVVDEPSIVAINRKTGETIAVGTKAMQMHEKTHENIKTIRPLKDGVIADFQAAESMIEGMISMIENRRTFFGHLKMVICIPSGITEVEKRAVFDSADHVDSKETYLIHEPMAAALGIGLDVQEPVGNMIIDIGGGTTEIAVIALSGIVCDQSIRIAGDEFTSDIMQYMKRQHNILIGERTAEQIKIHVGSALQVLDTPPDDYFVNGRDLMTGIPKQISVSYQEIAHALDKSISKIEEAVIKALETTPPELASDIFRRGLYLTGGGALLRGLDKRIAQKTKLNVHVAEDPLRAVVKGTGIALKNTDKFSFLIDRKSI
jgi:rod shape-determining protein MreB